jgi:uncharacterized protein with HEPN domain
MRRDELYVADLVDNTRAIREYLDGIISREQWDQDRVRRDAVVYRLLLLGETASALPDILRERYPDVAWRTLGNEPWLVPGSRREPLALPAAAARPRARSTCQAQ